jgi:hypothetical protein
LKIKCSLAPTRGTATTKNIYNIDRNCFCGFMEIEKIYLKMKSLQGRYQGICDVGLGI